MKKTATQQTGTENTNPSSSGGIQKIKPQKSSTVAAKNCPPIG